MFSGTGHVFDYALTPGMETLSVCCALISRISSVGARLVAVGHENMEEPAARTELLVRKRTGNV